nr:serine/arginine repetitive matrix protein 2-like [Ipomoea batatas]
MELFNFIFAVRHIPLRHGSGFLMAQSRGHFCSIPDLPDNNKGWKNLIVSVKYPWELPVPRVWSDHYTKHKFPTATRALKNAVVKISAESYEYWVFRSPESVTAAQLEPTDYSQPEKYVPKGMVGPSTAASTAETTERCRLMRLGMVLERIFATAPSGPKKPRPKVVLGVARRHPLQRRPLSDRFRRPCLRAPPGDLHRRPSFRSLAPPLAVRKKAIDLDVEEIPLKRQKRPGVHGTTPVLDTLREGSEQTTNFLDKVRSVIPTREAIRDLETDQVGEMIAQNVLWAAENVIRKEVIPLKESLATKDKELNEKVQALEGRVAQAERKVKAAKLEVAELNDRMSSYANLTGFLCRIPEEAEAFFRSFIHNEVGEGLAWRYREWAYAKGRYEMQREIHEALEESLNEKDLATIMGVVPDLVPAPGPMPYADPAPGFFDLERDLFDPTEPIEGQGLFDLERDLFDPTEPMEGQGLFDLERDLFDPTEPIAGQGLLDLERDLFDPSEPMAGHGLFDLWAIFKPELGDDLADLQNNYTLSVFIEFMGTEYI